MSSKIELRDIIKNNYMHEGKFKLSSGHVATRYFDIKGLMGHSLHSSLLLFELAGLIENTFVDDDIGSIGGIEFGGAIIAAAFPYNKNTCYIRKADKNHGMKKRIEGIPKSPILILDDVIWSGNTTLNAVAACFKAGYKVKAIICVVNRNQDWLKDNKMDVSRTWSLCGETISDKKEYPIYSLFKESDFE